MQIFTLSYWNKILSMDFKTIKYAVGTAYTTLANKETSVIPDLDSIISRHLLHSFKTSEILELISMFITIGSVVVDKEYITRILLKNKKHSIIDFLISQEQLSNEDVLNWYVPWWRNYNTVVPTLYHNSYHNTLMSIFYKYGLLTRSTCIKTYTEDSKTYKAISHAIYMHNHKLIEEFYNLGYHLKHTHFSMIDSVSIVSHIIKQYHPNKYSRFLKRFLYCINGSDIDKVFDEMKDKEECRWFFVYFKKRSEKFARFKYMSSLRERMLDYSKKCVEDKLTLLSTLNVISEDVVKYCVGEYLC